MQNRDNVFKSWQTLAKSLIFLHIHGIHNAMMVQDLLMQARTGGLHFPQVAPWGSSGPPGISGNGAKLMGTIMSESSNTEVKQLSYTENREVEFGPSILFNTILASYGNYVYPI